MSSKNCLAGANIKEDLRNKLYKTLDARVRSMGNTFPADMQVALVLKDLSQEAILDAKAKKYRQYLNVTAFTKYHSRLDDFGGRYTGKNLKKKAAAMARGLLSGLRHDTRGDQTFFNHEGLSEAIFAEHLSMAPGLAEIRQRFWRLGVGLDTSISKDIFDAASGKGTKNQAAKALLDQMRLVQDSLHARLKAAGADIPKLDGYLVPQKWNFMAVGDVPMDRWVTEALGNNANGVAIIDRSKMFNRSGKPLTEDELKDVLETAYETISTQGLNKWDEPNAGRISGSLTSKYSAERILHFTPEGWHHMASKYGDTNVMEAWLADVKAKSSDIAIMQIFGTNPQWTLDKTFAAFERKIGNPKITDPYKVTMNAYKDIMLGRTRGYSDMPFAKELSQGMSVTNNVLSGLALTKTVFTAGAGDALMNVINSFYTKTPLMLRAAVYFQEMWNGKQTAEEMIAQGFILNEMFSDFTHRMSFSTMDDMATWSGKFASASLEKGLLAPHTLAASKGAMMAHRRQIAKDVAVAFADLPRTRRDVYRQFGITEDMFNNHIRKAGTSQVPIFGMGVDVIDLNGLRGVDANTAQKLHVMMLKQTKSSVLQPDARATKAMKMTFGDHEKGSIPDLVARSMGFLKRFIAVSYFNISEHMGNEYASGARKAQAAMNYLVLGTALGAMSLQAKALLAGKDPQPWLMDDGSLNLDLMSQGFAAVGGVPIVSDFLLPKVFDKLHGNPEKFGSAWDLIPAYSQGKQAVKGSGDAIGEAYDGNYSRAGQILAGTTAPALAKAVTAPISKNWMFELLLNRFLYDRWEQGVNPRDFNKKVTAQQKFARQQGQDFYWRPGEQSPRRMPGDR